MTNTSVAQPNTLKASTILLRPRLTEKAVDGMGRNVYVFEVAQRANKVQIKTAIQEVYKVDPVKIAITAIPSKEKRDRRTGKFGTKSGGKKASVYLKEGQSISIM